MNTPEQFPVEPREESPAAGKEARLESESQTAPLAPTPEPAGEAFAGFPFAESAERPSAELVEPQYPPDLRVPWTTKDVVAFMIFYLASPFLLAIPVFIFVGVMHHRDISALKDDKALQGLLAVILQVLASAAAFGYLWFLSVARGAASFWSTLGWTPLITRFKSKRLLIGILSATGFILAVLVAYVSNLAGAPKDLPIEELMHSRAALIALLATSVLVAPLIEETVFRGLLYPVIARRLGMLPGVVITGILFGMVHAQQLWPAWKQIGLICLVGVIFTWVRASRKTVWASYIMHLSYNTALLIGTVIGTGGFRHM